MKECEALRYLGTSYVKIPRVVLNQVFSQDKTKRSLGHLHLAMFILSGFSDREELVNGKAESLGRGDLWISQSELADYAGMSRRMVKRYLDYLSGEGVVTMEKLGNRSRIHLTGYDCQMAPGRAGVSYGAPAVAEGLALRVAEEESRILGENKSRMDLVNYGS